MYTLFIIKCQLVNLSFCPDNFFALSDANILVVSICLGAEVFVCLQTLGAMAAKRPTKYMDYLHNPLSPVPKSTKYSRKQRQDSFKDKQSPEPCRNNETESTEDLGTIIDNQNDQKRVYDMLFDLQQQIGDDGDVVNDENDEIDIDDDDFNIDIDEDESDEVFLDDPINFPEFNPFQLLYTGAKVTYHDLAVLLITLKTAFNTSAILLLFVMKIIKMVVPENGLKALGVLSSYMDTLTIRT